MDQPSSQLDEISECALCAETAKVIRRWRDAYWLKSQEPPKNEITIASWERFMLNRDNCSTCARIIERFDLPAKFPNTAFKMDQSVIRIRRERSLGMVSLQRSNANTIKLTLLASMKVYQQTKLIELDPQWIDPGQLLEWISHCNEYHEGKCHHISGENQLAPFPRNLLLIDVQNLCLKVSENLPQYAALSYVWGHKARDFRASKSNIKSLLENRSIEANWTKLPRTITDAITLTQKLKIPFLWVDRLCIIQDDDVSLKQNIDMMAGIYNHSYVTIIAAQGDDAEFGLRGIGPESGPRDIFYQHYKFAELDFVEDVYVKRDVWHKRAWTLQEKVLSRRCIIFNAGTVSWDCQRLINRENCSQPRVSLYESWRENLHQRHRWPDFKNYSSLCRVYSRRNLGNQSDALRAFTAIINACSMGFAAGILWGMPEFVFHIALGWQHFDGESRTGFPSWSWLSWNGEFYFPRWDPTDLTSYWEHLPMGTWEKRDTTLGKWSPIDSSVMSWEELRGADEAHLPEGWTREINPINGTAYYQYKTNIGLGTNRFRCPLPLGSQQVELPKLQSWDRIVRGHVPSAKLKHGPLAVESTDYVAHIHCNDGTLIGRLSSCARRRDVIGGQSYQVIAVSRTRLKEGSETRLEWIVVLWITYGEDGIAYRQGRGYVYAEYWDKLDVQDIEVCLA